MNKQIFHIAFTVLLSSVRKNLLLASLLIMLPLLLAAWLFEASNPGFQTGFIYDAGGAMMAILAVIFGTVMSFEHLFWPVEQPTPWFYFSRLKSRIAFPAGKFIGISTVMASVLFDFSLLLIVFIRLTTGDWLFEPLRIAILTWAEYSVFLAVFIFLSTFLSRLMSVGLMLPIYFVAQSSLYLKETLSQPGINVIAEIILAIFPDTGIFESVLQAGEWHHILFAILYSLAMSAFYIILAGISLKRRDL